MKQFKKLLVIGASLSCVVSAQAATDAKFYGMGEAGVSASDYIYAPMYNPALVANFDTYQKTGIAIPSYVRVLDDPDLSAMSNGEMAYADQSLYMAYAMPNSVLTQNFYLHAQEQKVLGVDTLSTAKSVESSTRISEFGYTLAWFTPLRYNATFYTGFNMKVQQIVTSLSKNDYSTSNISSSFSDLTDTSGGDTDVNFDFGIAYRILNMTLGASVKNIMSYDYDSNLSDGSKATYEVAPQTTVSGTFDYTDMRFTLDYDLNKAERITKISNTNIDDTFDDSQYLKFGFEYYLHKDYTVRLGFINDFVGERSAQITMGLGTKLSKQIHLDWGLSYFGTNKYGAGVGMQITY